MTNQHAMQTARRLETVDDFLGVVGLTFKIPLHWAAYWATLFQSYRILGDELRLQHIALELDEDARDQQQLDYWRQTGIFSRVVWEDIGVRTTIFDEFHTHEQEILVSETQHFLNELLEDVSHEILFRAIDLDPKLVHRLHASLERLNTARTSEDMAHSALSCRRFLKLLADYLFPPTDEKRDGRRLGPSEWKNRLWAYSEDAIGSEAGAEINMRLTDIGKRIDAVADSANANVHRTVVERVAIARLIVALVSLTFDLTLLSPPPTVLPRQAYGIGIKNAINELLR